MKKKMKSFFTLKHHANDGFTLVELIVVIAILAILSGVAVPAYSGYVKKADRAADEVLLNALNKAFVSACMTNGENNYFRTDVDGEITDGAFTLEAADAIETSFLTFYEGGEFKVMTDLFYNKNLGEFRENAAVTFTFGDTTITLSAEDIAILSGDNAFSNRGSAALLNDVAVLENLLKTGIGQDVLDGVKQSDSFLWALGSYAGLVQGTDESDDAYLERVYVYSIDPNNADAIYSAQIMYSASNAANATDDQINALFTGDGAITGRIEVKNNGVRDDAATMANAALAYGMYTAYMQQYPEGDEDGNTDFTNVINSDSFETYFASEQGQTDLEAYRASMNMIGDNTNNPEVTGSILENGIAGNTDLADLMKEVMGS